MHRPTLLLIAGLLTLSPALIIPIANQPPGSTPCQVVADGLTAITPLKASVPEKRGRPIPNHLPNEPCRMTVQPPPRLRGVFRGRDSDTMGPYRLPAGTYQLYVQWIDHFIPGKSTPVLSPTLPSSYHHHQTGSFAQALHYKPGLLADEQRPTKATIWLTPSGSSAPELIDIITCPGLTLVHPIQLVAPAEFSLRITDDYRLADGGFDRRPSRAEARWRIATQ